MSGLYDANIQFLKDFIPDIYKQIIEEKAIWPAEIHEQEVDADNLLVGRNEKTCFVHSVYDKNAEFEEMCAGINEKHKTVVVLGLGSGYIFDYLRNRSFIDSLIIIEPSLDIFKQFMQMKDLREKFKKIKNIKLVLNQTVDESLEMCRTFIDVRSTFVFMPSYLSVFSDFSFELTSKLITFIRAEWLGNNNSAGLSPICISNTFTNYQNEYIFGGAIGEKIFSKYPAVVVSAGPSLNKHLPYIEELKKKAIIIAAGSSVKILNQRGIKPHFRITLDPFIFNKRDVFNEDFLGEIPLLFAGQTHPDVLKDYKGRLIQVVTATDVMLFYFCKKNGTNEYLVPTRYSVGNFAFDLLATHKCPQIILIGQDMCMYDGKIHAKGGPESDEVRDDRCKCFDIYGNEVYSIPEYICCKDGLEKSLKAYPYKVNVINATEGGLGIEGVPNMTLKDVMDNILTKELDIDVAEEVEAIYQEEIVKDKNRVEAINALFEDIDDLKKLIEERKEKIKEIEEQKGSEDKREDLLAQLDELEKGEDIFDKNDLYYWVIWASLSSKCDAIWQYCQITFSDELERRLEVIKRYTEEAEILLKMIEAKAKECDLDEL